MADKELFGTKDWTLMDIRLWASSNSAVQSLCNAYEREHAKVLAYEVQRCETCNKMAVSNEGEDLIYCRKWDLSFYPHHGCRAYQPKEKP
jgi:hypothetical protein